MASNSDPDPVVEALKANHDRTQLRESLRRSPQERIESLIEHLRMIEAIDRARARGPVK